MFFSWCMFSSHVASHSPVLIETPSALILSQVQCQWLCRGTSPTAREQILPRLCCSSFHQGETCQTNYLTFAGIHRRWGSRWIQLPFLCAHSPPWSIVLDSTCLLAKVIVRCSCLNSRRQDEADWRSSWSVFLQLWGDYLKVTLYGWRGGLAIGGLIVNWSPLLARCWNINQTTSALCVYRHWKAALRNLG